MGETSGHDPSRASGNAEPKAGEPTIVEIIKNGDSYKAIAGWRYTKSGVRINPLKPESRPDFHTIRGSVIVDTLNGDGQVQAYMVRRGDIIDLNAMRDGSKLFMHSLADVDEVEVGTQWRFSQVVASEDAQLFPDIYLTGKVTNISVSTGRSGPNLYASQPSFPLPLDDRFQHWDRVATEVLGHPIDEIPPLPHAVVPNLATLNE